MGCRDLRTHGHCHLPLHRHRGLDHSMGAPPRRHGARPRPPQGAPRHRNHPTPRPRLQDRRRRFPRRLRRPGPRPRPLPPHAHAYDRGMPAVLARGRVPGGHVAAGDRQSLTAAECVRHSEPHLIAIRNTSRSAQMRGNDGVEGSAPRPGRPSRAAVLWQLNGRDSSVRGAGMPDYLSSDINRIPRLSRRVRAPDER